MKITAKKHNDAVLCTFPDGESIEITMVSVAGEDVFTNSSVDRAMGLLKANLRVLAPQKLKELAVAASTGS